MIVVTGTKRSGTSLWMHLLVEAGLPFIGDRFPAGWPELLRQANPDGFFESELMAGVYFRTNPHPLTGAYLAPAQTREHAVKIFIPGLVRTDVAFIDRCLATVRSWREYVVSARRVRALAAAEGAPPPEDGLLPPALEWWCNNYALLRDLAIRGYPVHVVSYDGLLRDPARMLAEVLEWIGRGDASRVAELVRPELRTAGVEGLPADDALAEGIEPRHLETFDALYEAIDGERPLTDALVERLNQTHDALRPRVLEHEANADAMTIADVLGRG
ncbi:MAG: hypothetical protein KDK70_36150 [Myxococcales bacterium]|nr:hypothetical protein [Myxococcales bacterium]